MTGRGWVGDEGSATVAEDFYAGRYGRVAARWEGGKAWSAAEWPLLVGALAFLGRQGEAEAVGATPPPAADDGARAEAAFHLLLGATRRADLKRCRELLGWLTGTARRTRRGDCRFFADQGLGFFRFFQGYPARASAAADRALTQALRLHLRHHTALALDLKGQALVQCGRVSEGLSLLEAAGTLAHELGMDGLAAAIGLSLAVQRAAHGVGGVAAVAALREAARHLRPENNFSLAHAFLELSRQEVLCGRLGEAWAMLRLAAPLVAAADHRRLRIIFGLRHAYVCAAAGRMTEAAAWLAESEACLAPGVDVLLGLQAQGLRRRLDPRDESAAASDEARWARDASATRHHVSRRMWARARGVAAASAAGQDPLGDLMDRVAAAAPGDKAEKALAVAESGYLGLAGPLLGFRPDGRDVCFDVPPGGALIHDRGDYALRDKGLTPAVRRFLGALGPVAVKKEDLVRVVWGYFYDPLRHDPLVYTLVNRVRGFLGHVASWLVAEDGGYRWADGVTATFLAPAAAGAPRAEAWGESAEAPPAREASTILSHRQWAILRHLAEHPALGVAEASALWKASRATLSRDFAQLKAMGYVETMGRGRAVTYRRAFLGTAARPARGLPMHGGETRPQGSA